jgi:hypothetical protein
MTNDERIALIPRYTNEWYEEQQTQRLIAGTVSYHFTAEQVDRIIAALRLVQIIDK